MSLTQRAIRCDVRSFDHARDPGDESSIVLTIKALDLLISKEIDEGIAAERIVLAGFAQGAAMSLLTGLTIKRRLGGIVVLSGWLMLREKIAAVRKSRLNPYIMYG